MLRLSCSTLLYCGHPLEVALSELKGLHFQLIDLWSVPRMCPHADPDRDDVNELRRKLEAQGLRLSALSVYLNDAEGIGKRLDLAQALGADTVIYGPGQVSKEDFAAWSAPLIAKCERLGLKFAIENHVNALGDTLESMLEMLEAIGSEAAGICYAPPHSVRLPEDVESVIRGLGDRLCYLYLWDSKLDRRTWEGCTPDEQTPGGGDLDWASILRTLSEVGYEGVLNFCWHGTEEWDPAAISASIARGRSLIEAAAREAC